MKKITLGLILAIFFIACQKEQKIAYVDNSKIINEYYKKKDFEAKFKLKVDNFNKKADSLQKTIQMEAQLWQTRAAKMNQSKAEEEYNVLVQKKQMQDYQLSNEEKALQSEGQLKIDSLVTEVKDFVKDYGKSNGYMFILGANEAGSVMYGDETIDITEEILAELNGSVDDK